MSFSSSFHDYDDIFHQDGDSNYFYDPFNLRGYSMLNEIGEFRNDIFNTSLIDDYNNNVNNANNENNDNQIDNNINGYQPDVNNRIIQRIFTTPTNGETASSTKVKATNSTKICGEPKTANKSKLGRKRKDEINNEDIDNGKVHTKDDPDNIEVKYKRLFLNNLINYSNELLKESPNPKLNSLRLLKLNSDYAKSLKKDVVVKMLDSPASEALSQKIAEKYKRYDKNHNRDIINLIYKENEESLINVLSKYTKELMEAFRGNTDDDSLLKNYRLEDSIRKLSKKESKDYIEKLRDEAKNFENNIRQKTGRDRTSKKDKKININSI